MVFVVVVVVIVVVVVAGVVVVVVVEVVVVEVVVVVQLEGFGSQPVKSVRMVWGQGCLSKCLENIVFFLVMFFLIWKLLAGSYFEFDSCRCFF